ncbi:MAG: M48 family metallopeptidase [Spirulinaceae cyanobacterium]
MKLAWNSLLLSLTFLLPTSVVLAEPYQEVEENLEVAEELFVPQDLSELELPENLNSELILVQESEPNSTPETIVIPDTIPTEDREEVTAKEEAVEEEETEVEDVEEGEQEKEELTPEELACLELLKEGDEFYLSGEFAAAAEKYRQAKEPFAAEVAAELVTKPEAIYEPNQLPPGGAVYWQNAQEGIEQELDSKALISLDFLVEKYPEFIPGYLLYAQELKKANREEEILPLLERATTLYPQQPDLIAAKVTAYGEEKQWLEASLAARQFALINPEHERSGEFLLLAEENLDRYTSNLRATIRGNGIANIITGIVGFVVTGGLFGPFSAAETTLLLIEGESAVGEKISNRMQRYAPMVEDEEVLAYVNDIGYKLAQYAGRDEFDYRFYVIMDDSLNAFALPGGKIFLHAGVIADSNSEAELAGLIAHELSHAVLSHGFQLVTQGNLTANLAQFIPFGGTAAQLLVLNYSRDMERQADVLGTRILAGSNYAADGLRNLMLILDEKDLPRPPAWLSSHPGTGERVDYLESLIIENGYDRYSYEGALRHSEIKEKIKKLIEEYKQTEEYKNRR